MLAILMAACGTTPPSPPPSAHADLVDWVRMEGGTFTMGTDRTDVEERERPAHEVTLAAFDIARTEITVAQYRTCVDEGPCAAVGESKNCYWRRPGRPRYVQNCLSWQQARTFCEFVGGRLPTEAEWEYAARGGGRDVEYPWGSEPEPDCTRVVMDDERGSGCGGGGVLPPCTRPEGNTPQGLCDMAGNAFEWVEDGMTTDYSQASPTGAPPDHPFEDGSRVMRGGAIRSEVSMRTRQRTFHTPDFHYGGMSARCAR
ncbi:MAG: SUMF1/EgtB/PvdO family nonheme iron enzyme [Myxococcales bacterium]|nr:SUMF1/EgtB/PvdO family nonheme iron enzyme [Myxococcales bacterium]